MYLIAIQWLHCNKAYTGEKFDNDSVPFLEVCWKNSLKEFLIIIERGSNFNEVRLETYLNMLIIERYICQNHDLDIKGAARFQTRTLFSPTC